MAPPPARGRPVVGITCYEEDASFGRWHQRAALLPVTYLRAVEAAGAVAVILPPQQLSVADAAGLADRLDGLVIAGGGDVDPARYGEEADARTVVAHGERDALELAAVEAAEAAHLPTLAICRGLQVLNVARGGTLIQHLPDVVGSEIHSPTPGSMGAHEVDIVPGTALAQVLGWTSSSVPTHHHQGIDRLGAGLVVAARAADGVVEAVEDPERPFLLAVQWHPEAGDDPALFEALVAAATARRLRRDRSR